MKKHPGPPHVNNSSHPTDEQATAAKLSGEFLRKMLVMSERSGTLRTFLTDLSKNLKSLDSQSSESAAKISRECRVTLSYYLLSLIHEFDADTKGELLETVIFDLLRRANAKNATEVADVYQRIEVEDHAADHLHLAMRHLIPNYCDLVREGFTACISDLPHFAIPLVRLLNEIAIKDPGMLEGAAEDRIDWPIMTSRNHPKPAQFNQFADTIGLASKSPIKPKPKHSWRLDTPLNQYIVRMLIEECWGDQRLLNKDNVPYYLDEVLMPLFERVAQEVGGWEHYPEFAQIAQSAGKRGKAGTQRSEIRSRVKAALDAMAT